MRKALTLMTLMSAVSLSACGGMPHPESAAPGVPGSSYIVISDDFHLPARGDKPAVSGVPMSLDDYMDMADLDQQCWTKIKPYIPAASKEIAEMGIRTGIGSGIGNAIGTGLGAISAFTGVGFGAYAAYGGLAGLFGGAGSGAAAAITQHHIAVNFAQYACMTFAVNTMHRHGRLRGVAGVAPWAGPANPRPTLRPVAGVHQPTDDELWNRDHPEDAQQPAASPAILPGG